MKEYQKNNSDINPADKFRKIFAKKLKKAKIIQPNNNQGIIFLTDKPTKNLKISAIHSEPPINEKRFFISIMCADEKTIMESIKPF